ncbi:50S ribosomal protein L25/general stress protein Ctc [Mobiluncus mulieris]|uniref:Large ribosomal subunit protein bL25 n=1 Tax=Mobiluncus mulieris TaxID=2052 RepID=A0A7Y0U3U6_9ACTO|nr:50S ribosomal protein L25/general stress protein Ctc [Mobiluncus mulieris]NMW65953.1 50S ribosomal protein L25/general stress protein Ctc [Mobiluncus mulieris]
MAEKHILKVSERTEFGKGFARRARMNDQIPAVVYGHGADPVHVVLPYHDTFLLVKDNPNAVISLEGLKKPAMVLVKDIQRHPVKRSLMHLDLLLVKADEKVNVEVPVVVVGEPAVGTVANLDLLHVEVLAPVVDIPETIEVNVDGMQDGEVLLVSEMKLPAGVEAVTDGETVVLSVAVPQEVAVPESSGEEAAGAEESAATEGAGEAE